MVRVGSGVGRVRPRALDLTDEFLFVGLRAFLNILAFGFEVGLELRSFPFGVWSCNLGVPVLLDKILQVLAISRSWVRDVVI